MEKLIMRTRQYRGHLVLTVDGRLTMLTMDQFRDALDAGVDSSGIVQVIIDVSKTEFVDSNGLGALVSAQKALHARDGYVRLVKPRSGLLETLNITHLNTILPQYETLDDAVAAGPQTD